MSIKGVSKLIGQRFGRLVVLRHTGESIKGQIIFEMQCDCGRIINMRRDYFDRKNRGTKQCTICREEGYTKGAGEILGRWWNERFLNRAVGKARSKYKHSIPYDIDVEFAWDLFLKQNKRCALSGQILTFPTEGVFGGTASLDRIDSKKGYFRNNVQWVHNDINIMKNSFSQDHFIELCTLVTKTCSKTV